MQLTAWAPIGLLQCSEKDPPSIGIYNAQRAAFGEGSGNAFDLSEGTRIEAICFARAMGLARMQVHLEQAAAERLPDDQYWMVPVREREFGIVPGAHATLAERRAVIAERERIPLGGSTLEIEQALTRLLGDGFVMYRPTPVDDAVLTPAACGDFPMNLQRPDVARKLCKLTSAVSFVGSPQTVGFQMETGATLEVGDVVVFDPGQWGLADRVTIDAIGGGPSTPTLTATFVYPHSQGAWGTTMPYPEWSSDKRHSLVVVTPAVAADQELRRQIHDLMSRRVTAASTWHIVEATGDGSATEAFLLDEESLDRRTLETVTL